MGKQIYWEDTIRFFRPEGCDPVYVTAFPAWRCENGLHIYDPERKYRHAPGKGSGKWVMK